VTDANDVAIGGVMPDEEVWLQGTWKTARALASKGNSRRIDWSHARISTHFAMFTAVLTQHIGRHAYVKDMATANHFLVSCFGFPVFYATPSLFVERRSTQRFLHYAREHWPKFYPEPAVPGAEVNHEILR